jgi:hypothetical protein
MSRRTPIMNFARRLTDTNRKLVHKRDQTALQKSAGCYRLSSRAAGLVVALMPDSKRASLFRCTKDQIHPLNPLSSTMPLRKMRLIQ